MKFFPRQKPIFTSLSPNTQKDDILLALKLILKPKKWKKGEAVKELELEFKKYLKVKHAISFNSGRSAFLAILEALEINKGEEVLLQAFTCNSAVNPILERGAKPIFVDIDDTLNLAPVDLRKKITLRSKVVMVQHTFGWPAQIEEISKIAKENNLFLIEDSAHSLGAKYKEMPCGTFGEAAFFSLGRDKIISSVFGGMAVTNNLKVGQRLKEIQEKIDYPSNFWIFQQLLHPILTNYLMKPAYGLNKNLGRILFGFLHRLSVLSKAVSSEEKKGKLSQYFPKRFPNALAVLALNQFDKLEKFNNHRRKIATLYQNQLKETNFILPLANKKKKREPVFLRYPVLINFETDELLELFRKSKIFLDDGWRKKPIVPPDTILEKMDYRRSSCPKAEEIARKIVNLPTHINISEEKAQKIIQIIKNL